MRSTWSAESVLAVLAAATVEAAGLTLAYLALSWLSGRVEITVGVPGFAVAVILGMALARRLRRASWRRYLLVLPAAAILAGVVGGWLAERLAGSAGDLLGVLSNAATWMLGIAVLRGTAHAELDDEAYVVDRVVRVGMPGLALFWIVGAASGLPSDPAYTAAAFGATLTFVSSGLLGLGLGRLRQLRVETIDGDARRRWLVLLLGVTGLVLVVGVPLAALLQVPLATALAGAGGPIAVTLVLAFLVITAPVILALSALAHAIGPVDFHLSLPTIALGRGDGAPPSVDLVTVVVAVFGSLLAAELVAILIVVAAVLRRRRKRRGAGGPELREAEPLALDLHLPRLRRRGGSGGEPNTAVEAYRLVLELLVGRDEERLHGETPREHAARIRGTEVGRSVGRLAADYQLAALAGRQLNAAEERRAQGRWQRVRRWAR